MSIRNFVNLNRQMPMDNLLNKYLNQEGIDSQYTNVILRELYDATELTNEQLNQAAKELISTNDTSDDMIKTSSKSNINV